MNINRALKVMLFLALIAAGVFAAALRLNKIGAPQATSASGLPEHDDALEIPIEFR